VAEAAALVDVLREGAYGCAWIGRRATTGRSHMMRSVAPGQHQVSVPPTGCGAVAPPPGDHRRPIDALWQARPRAAYILTPGSQSSLGPFANPGGNRNLPNMEVCRDPRLYRCGPLVAAFAGHDAAQTAEFHPPSIPPGGRTNPCRKHQARPANSLRA